MYRNARPMTSSPPMQYGAVVKPASARRDALGRGRARAIARLLLGCGDAAAAEGFTIGSTGAALGTMKLLANEFTAGNPGIPVTTVPGLGSSEGIKAVLDGGIGLAVTSRPIDGSERKLGAIENEYARTPFALAVSTESSVIEITARELADIYVGRITAWANGSPVRVVLRRATESDTEMTKHISPDMRRGVLASAGRLGVRSSVTDQDAANDLEKIAGALGPSTLALIVSEKPALRALKLDGKEPTPMNAASGAYPYYKRLFFVKGAKRLAAVERFIAFVQSPAGRKTIVSHGQWIP